MYSLPLVAIDSFLAIYIPHFMNGYGEAIVVKFSGVWCIDWANL